jgi:hypothetical protein
MRYWAKSRAGEPRPLRGPAVLEIVQEDEEVQILKVSEHAANRRVCGHSCSSCFFEPRAR